LAQCYVGLCYQYGYGIIKNENLALEYYKKVDNKYFIAEQFKVGYFYSNGIGIEKDLKKSFSLV